MLIPFLGGPNSFRAADRAVPLPGRVKPADVRGTGRRAWPPPFAIRPRRVACGHGWTDAEGGHFADIDTGPDRCRSAASCRVRLHPENVGGVGRRRCRPVGRRTRRPPSGIERDLLGARRNGSDGGTRHSSPSNSLPANSSCRSGRIRTTSSTNSTNWRPASCARSPTAMRSDRTPSRSRSAAPTSFPVPLTHERRVRLGRRSRSVPLVRVRAGSVRSEISSSNDTWVWRSTSPTGTGGRT